MKQKKWFNSGVASLLMVTTFFVLFSMFACKNPSDSGNIEAEKFTVTFSVMPKDKENKATLTAICDKANLKSGNKVEKGKIIKFTLVITDNNYKVKSWSLDATPASDSMSATATATKNLNVVVTLEEKQITNKFNVKYAVTPITGADISAAYKDGSGMVATNTDVDKDKQVVITVAPKAGYTVKEWKGVEADNIASNKLSATITVTKAFDITVELNETETTEKVTVKYRVEPGNGARILAYDGSNIVIPGKQVEKNKSIRFALSSLSKKYQVKEWKDGSVKVADNVMEYTQTVTKDVDIVVILEEKQITEKKDAEITYVSINTEKWDPIKKTVTLINPTGGDITINDVKIKAKSTDGNVAEDVVEVLSIEPKVAGIDKLDLDKGDTANIVIKSKETDKLKSATVEVTVHVANPLKRVFFSKFTVSDPITTSAERVVKFDVTYPSKFELPVSEEFIDSILTLKGNANFPNGTKIVLKSKRTLKDNSEELLPESTFNISNTTTAKIFGHTIYGAVPRATLTDKHHGAKESYDLIITLPEIATDDEYEVIVEYALFADKDTENVKRSLGKSKFKIRGYEIQKVTPTVTVPCINVASDATKATKEITYTITYPDFSWKEGQFIDSIIKMKDDTSFPEDTEFTVTIDNGAPSESYKISGADVKKMFLSVISHKNEHPSLEASLKEKTETIKLTIKLPASATNQNYVLTTQSVVFDSNINTDVEQTPLKTLGEPIDLTITGFGKE